MEREIPRSFVFCLRALDDFLGFRLKCRGTENFSSFRKTAREGWMRTARARWLVVEMLMKYVWTSWYRVCACFNFIARGVREDLNFVFFSPFFLGSFLSLWRAFEVLDATIWPHAQNVFLLLLFCSHAIITNTFSSFSPPNNQNRKEQRKSNLGHRPFTRRMTSKSRSSRKPSRKRRTKRSCARASHRGPCWSS